MFLYSFRISFEILVIEATTWLTFRFVVFPFNAYMLGPNIFTARFTSSLLINNADRKRYGDLQTEKMNSYTQNRIIYPQSVTDAKRMINNYVAKFVPMNNSNKNKGKKQDDDYEPTKKEELLFLQQQNERWEYCGWYKKEHPAVYDGCVCIKNSRITQAMTKATSNKIKQETRKTNSKQ